MVRAAVAEGGFDGTAIGTRNAVVLVSADGRAVVEVTKREWYAAVLDVAREVACRSCGHAAYVHRVSMLGSNVRESCDNVSVEAALRSTCLCRRLELPEGEARRVAEWMVAERVAKALDGPEEGRW